MLLVINVRLTWCRRLERLRFVFFVVTWHLRRNLEDCTGTETPSVYNEYIKLVSYIDVSQIGLTKWIQRVLKLVLYTNVSQIAWKQKFDVNMKLVSWRKWKIFFTTARKFFEEFSNQLCCFLLAKYPFYLVYWSSSKYPFYLVYWSSCKIRSVNKR